METSACFMVLHTSITVATPLPITCCSISMAISRPPIALENLKMYTIYMGV